MRGVNSNAVRAGLEALFLSRAHKAMSPFVGGVGAMLTLHHVRPQRRGSFQPNRVLEITPEFFRAAIERLRLADVDFVSLDEMHRRLIAGDDRRRFVCLTFDDGYRDLIEFAYPILCEFDLPYVVYIPTSFPDRFGFMWWAAIEAVVANSTRIDMIIEGAQRTLECSDVAGKGQAFEKIYWWIRSRETEGELRAIVSDLCARYGVDLVALCEEFCMDWQQIAELARDPRTTIGAHTVNHAILKKASAATARDEMERSRSEIEKKLGVRPQHLAYPVGDPTSAGEREFRTAAELGFKTGVTTRPGVIFPEHRDHLMALPRIPLDGEFQQARYVDVLMSGAATALWNGFRRVEPDSPKL